MSQIAHNVSKYALAALYVFGILFCVPLSFAVWFVRNNLFNEKSVAGLRVTERGIAHIENLIEIMLVVIIHPEQWNGGSDRCTLALIKHFRASGHRVVWLTTMIDKYWQGEDFSNVEIHEVRIALHPGDWFSQNVALGYHLCFSGINPDLVVVDHSASCIPMIKWRFPQTKVLFYCHFPQQLVTPERFFLYRWYSRLISIIEEWLFKDVDLIMVNSKFTAKNFRLVMPEASNKVRVVYPPCDVDSLSVSLDGGGAISRKARPQNPEYVFLSMNRFWPEKRLDIILDAAVILKEQNQRVKIQVAGSVMPHIPESRIYFQLLRERSMELGLDDIIEFVISPSEAKKFELYRNCDSVLYTPPLEHFGIVPIEALQQRRPVIAIDSGGPAETVIENVTGTKIEYPCGKLLANAMIEHMNKEVWEHLDLDEHFQVQKIRFEREYSSRGFGRRLDEALVEIFSQSVSIGSAPLDVESNIPPSIVVNGKLPSTIVSKGLSQLPVSQQTTTKKHLSADLRKRRMA